MLVANQAAVIDEWLHSLVPIGKLANQTIPKDRLERARALTDLLQSADIMLEHVVREPHGARGAHRAGAGGQCPDLGADAARE